MINTYHAYGTTQSIDFAHNWQWSVNAGRTGPVTSLTSTVYTLALAFGQQSNLKALMTSGTLLLPSMALIDWLLPILRESLLQIFLIMLSIIVKAGGVLTCSIQKCFDTRRERKRPTHPDSSWPATYITPARVAAVYPQTPFLGTLTCSILGTAASYETWLEKFSSGYLIKPEIVF